MAVLAPLPAASLDLSYCSSQWKQRLLLLNLALKKPPMPKPPWISSTKKGLTASKQLSHVARTRNKEGKAGKMGREGVAGEAMALLAGRVICRVTLDVSFIPPSLVSHCKLEWRPLHLQGRRGGYCYTVCLCCRPSYAHEHFILGVRIKYKCCCHHSDLLTYTAMDIAVLGLNTCQWFYLKPLIFKRPYIFNREQDYYS